MDNAYGKGEKNNKRPESVNAVPIKIPKNIRQVGNIGNRSKIIYVEDYVMTFIKQFAEKDYTGCKVAILLGYYVRTEESKNIFIKGAVEMRGGDFSNGILFTDEGWTSIYESIKTYFTEVEIVGWTLIGPEFFLEGLEKIQKIHVENFPGADKLLLKMDSMEKEEAFYLNENNQLVKQNGYYIYYEKNEEMQNYMVENKEEGFREELNYIDHTTKKIRTIIQDKKEVKDDRNVVRLLYAASSLLAIIVLVIAATMLDNYDKMKSMESAINTISENLKLVDNDKTSTEDINQAADDNHSEGDQLSEENQEGGKQLANKDSVSDQTDLSSDTLTDTEDNLTSDIGETIDVETVPGNLLETQTADTQETDTKETDELEDVADNSEQESNAPTTTGDSNDNSSPDDTSDSNTNSEDAVEASTKVNYYIVRPGDSLAAISYELYNTFSYMDEIKELNQIEDENKIFIGQKLIVP